MKLQRCCASASKAGSACWGRIIHTPSCASDGWTASAYNNKLRVAREFQRCCCAAVLCFTAAKRRQHAARAAAPTAVRRALFAIRIVVAAVMHAIASPPPPTQPQQPSSLYCSSRAAIRHPASVALRDDVACSNGTGRQHHVRFLLRLR